eukprot:scaffold583182_cov18-Prasinocladus_malaysianus.AAC.1
MAVTSLERWDVNAIGLIPNLASKGSLANPAAVPGYFRRDALARDDSVFFARDAMPSPSLETM